MILGFDWWQRVNPKVDWVSYGLTLKNCFVAAGVPAHYNIKVEYVVLKSLCICYMIINLPIVSLHLFSRDFAYRDWIVVFCVINFEGVIYGW